MTILPSLSVLLICCIHIETHNAVINIKVSLTNRNLSLSTYTQIFIQWADGLFTLFITCNLINVNKHRRYKWKLTFVLCYKNNKPGHFQQLYLYTNQCLLCVCNIYSCLVKKYIQPPLLQNVSQCTVHSIDL